MLANCDVIVSFPIYDQFGAIRKSDAGCLVCKTIETSIIDSSLVLYLHDKAYICINNILLP